MTTLVVQAHPLTDSFNAALLDRVLSESPSAAVLRIGQGDRLTPYSCIGVTQLVAVYPTWWGSVPAVLLEALEQLIGAWVDGEQSTATSPLRSVESLRVITTHGSSKLINMLQGEPGLQLWKHTVLPLCAPGAAFDWHALYKIDRASAADRTTFLESVVSP